MDSSLIDRVISEKGSVIVAITGIKAFNLFTLTRFWWYAIPSKLQVGSAEGILHSELQQRESYHHTFTIWESRQAMLKYVHSGSHLEAMKNHSRIGTGKVYSYETSSIPTFDEAVALWNDEARDFCY